MTAFLARHAGHVIVLGGPLLILAGMLLRLQLTDPGRTRQPVGRPLRTLALAATWVAAASVHLAVTPEHFAESTVLGVFFLALAGVQLVYAGALWWWPERRLLLAGMATNAAVIALWVWSRTVSLPFGLGPREAPGAADLATTALEAASLVLSFAVLRGRQDPTRPGRAAPIVHNAQLPPACP